MSETSLRLGETLVEAGILTKEALDKALSIQKKRQLRLGTILLQEGFVSESQLVQALSLKLSIPWVSLWRIDVPDDILDMVPANVAEEFFLMPIYIRTSKSGERALYVAMNDPTDEDALRFVSANAGMPVKPMIAGPTDIAAAIRAYYYDEEVGDDFLPPDELSAAPIPPPSNAAPPIPPPPPKPFSEEMLEDEDIEELDEGHLEEEALDEPEPETIETAAEPVDEPLTQEASTEEATAEGEDAAADEDEDSEEKIFADKRAAQREAERRLYGVGATKPKGGFSLTLLDGTTLSFGPGKKKEQPSAAVMAGKLTREDLLSGLKAAAQGTPLEDFLPAAKWESYMAAILKVLFNKHLVFFEEFLKELEQIEEK